MSETLKVVVDADGVRTRVYRQDGSLVTDTVASAVLIEALPAPPSTTFWDATLDNTQYSLNAQVPDPGW